MNILGGKLLNGTADVNNGSVLFYVSSLFLPMFRCRKQIISKRKALW